MWKLFKFLVRIIRNNNNNKRLKRASVKLPFLAAEITKSIQIRYQLNQICTITFFLILFVSILLID